MAPTHSHQPGVLKRPNKTHKHGKHASNRELDRENRGRVPVKETTKRKQKILNKIQRKHQMAQIRQRKQNDVITQKRLHGQCPHILSVISLSADVNAEDTVNMLIQCADGDTEQPAQPTLSVLHHIRSSRYKTNYSVIKPPVVGDVNAALDCAKVADTILLLLSANESSEDGVISDYGEYLLTLLNAQGLPNVLLIISGLDEIPQKNRGGFKKCIQKAVSKWLPDEKVLPLSTVSDAQLILRHASSQKHKLVAFRQNRPYILIDRLKYTPTNAVERGDGQLHITGYVRGGTSLSVNSVLHIVEMGDYHMSHIVAADRTTQREKDGVGGEDVALTLARADPRLQQALDSEAQVDEMAGEQTWPTEDELDEAQRRTPVDSAAAAEALRESDRKVVRRRVPKGTSEYQAAWILDDDGDGGSADDDDDDDAQRTLSDENEDEQMSSCGSGSGEEDTTVADSGSEDGDAGTSMDTEDQHSQYKRYMEEFREHARFPDEVDTPFDVPARQRFARYRGLQSFRNTLWDPKENLPSDYARIFQFENFSRTRKKILKEKDTEEGVAVGSYVKVCVNAVTSEQVAAYERARGSRGVPLLAYALLPHEQRVSVVHFLVRRHAGFAGPLRSKEPLVFHVGGARRFAAAPVFSQHTVASKHKFERFLPMEGYVVATVFAPIVFPPASVLVFREGAHGESDELVATGGVLSVNPNRVIVKRIVLSGHAFRVHKRSAVVRYMFFNREDITWFKPVELHTKHGRRGHIKEPVGTHGHMKCVFDKQLKSQDTVLLRLYKRVYPKWTYRALG